MKYNFYLFICFFKINSYYCTIKAAKMSKKITVRQQFTTTNDLNQKILRAAKRLCINPNELLRIAAATYSDNILNTTNEKL